MTTTAQVVPAAAPLMDWEYELLAGADTAEGWKAWNAGNYPHAVAMWLSAARWSQYADKACGGAR